MKTIFTVTCQILQGSPFTPEASAQQQAAIPKKALKELEFMTVTWETEMYENGEKVGKSVGERKWSPNKYCLLFSTKLDLHRLTGFGHALCLHI